RTCGSTWSSDSAWAIASPCSERSCRPDGEGAARSRMAESTKVLYVVGTQRGGTTIVGRLLGALPGFTFAGEVRRIWGRLIPNGQVCGCGRRFEECPVWGPA